MVGLYFQFATATSVSQAAVIDAPLCLDPCDQCDPFNCCWHQSWYECSSVPKPIQFQTWYGAQIVDYCMEKVTLSQILTCCVNLHDKWVFIFPMSPSTLPLCYIDQTAAPSPAAAAHPSTGSTHRPPPCLSAASATARVGPWSDICIQFLALSR